MIFLTPLGLLGLLSLPVIYLIHLLRGTRRRHVVPATFLWADLPVAPSGYSRRRLPPITLLLLLQLLAAALASLALARPALSSAPARHLALVVDASASMQATDVAPSRFAAAIAAASGDLAQLAPTDRVSVIRAGPAPSLVSTGAPTSARLALNALAPGATASSLHDALELASVEVSKTPSADDQIVVYTDAAGSPLSAVGTLAAPVRFSTVGGGAENQAIVNLQVRTQPGDARHEAYVEAANYADHAVEAPLQTSGDNQVIDRRTISLGPRARVGVTIPVPAGIRSLTARLLVQDALALDNRADTVIPLATRSDVQLIAPQPATMQRVLSALPFVQLHPVSPGTEMSGAAATVVQGALPDPLPNGPLLLVNPPSDSPLFAAPGDAAAAPDQDFTDAAQPLVQGVDLDALRLDSTFTAGFPGWADLVLGTREAPLIFDGRVGGKAIVVFAFDPATGIDKSLAFPLLVSNTVGYLLSQQGDTAVHTGASLLVPAPSAGHATLTRPDGSQLPLAGSNGSAIVPSDAVDQVGRYVVGDNQTGATLRGFVASMLNAQASDIRPRPLPDLPPPSSPMAAGVPRTLTEWWPWLAAASLTMLALEWLVFARRG
jgi:hypothetical protein